MTEPNPDLDARLARLAARRAGAKSAASPDSASASNSTRRPRTRRKHPAAAARILSLGLSSSAFFSIIGAFGQQTPHASVASAVRPRPSAPVAPAPVLTKVIVKYVHHQLFVDQYGRPVPPPTAASGAATATAGTRSVGAAPSYRAAPRSGAPASGSPAARATPPPMASPAPNAPAVAPQPTTPAPRPTTPPPTVVTTPVPPPPPACSGTKCP